MTLDSFTEPTGMAGGPRRRRLHPIVAWGIVIMTLIILAAIFAPMIYGDAAERLTDDRRMPMSLEYPLGTDEFGRDLFARALVATRLTAILTVCASAISIGGGVTIGALVWFLPAKARRLVVGANSVAVAFPGLVLALVIAAILGPGAWTAAFAVGIASVPVFIRLTVNMATPIMSQDYVAIARLLRVPRLGIIRRHVLPNIAEPLLVLSASNFAVNLIDLSGLSFIGLGVQSPQYDFGRLLSDGLVSIYAQPTQVIGPSIMIMLTGLGAMLIGDGLAAQSNPRTRAAIGHHKTGMLHRRGWQDDTDDSASGTEQAKVAPAPETEDNGVHVRDLYVETASGLGLVKGVSFDIRVGEIVALVGESGSGKSLTAMTVAGLVPEGVNARATSIRVAGHDMLSSPSRTELARDIGLIYQDPTSTFNPALKLNTQLTEVLRTHLGHSKQEARDALVKKLNELKVTKPELRTKQRAHELSGGMLQRAMIASSLLTESKVLVADEPTTALDVTVQVNVLRNFLAAVVELDASVLFISHDLGVVRELADRVLVMYRGEIVERLSSRELSYEGARHWYTKKLLDAAKYVEADDREPKKLDAPVDSNMGSTRA